MWIVNCFCSTDFRNISETEPTFIGHYRNPDEPKIIWLYSDHPNLPIDSPKTDNQGYYTNSRPSVAFTDVDSSVRVAKPMKLVAPQILYDFQRPPRVERQPVSASPRLVQNHNRQSYNNVPNVISSAQTRNVVQHPLYNIQPQYYIPKKYGLMNGKLVYDPTSLQLVQRPVLPTFYHSTQQFPHFQQPVLYQHHQRQQLLPQPVAITRLPPITKSHFKAPPRSQFQPIDTPSEMPEQQEEPSGEEKPVSEDIEEEESEDKANYEEDDDEAEHYGTPEFEKYFHDDEDDHEQYEHIENSDDEEEDDSDRGSTSFVPSRKFPKKYYFKPEKKSEIKYGPKNNVHPKYKSIQKPKKKQKMQYESYRYSKDSAKYPEVIEGLQSKQIPVTHKQKILKEKWYLTKSSDNEQFD
ncbi:unnamed protein product [Phaedon cochleariae]|uniref:Uncharacterized protein n=1 Tax=Phaedon cochleariae TaxID=80249 RepID=A0A9P0DN00_PHACE|nr:unnamed protein product [Phaedon cochleariae]